MRPTVAAWAVTRVLLLLLVLKVLALPGPDVTTDVSVIYQGWFEVLRTGTFPLGDVTWQYPPGASLPVLAPGLLPFLDYPTAFYLLVLHVDALVLAMLLRAGRDRGHGPAGARFWVAGVALLGPTAYARYDVMVTAVAVAALLAAARHPRAAGALAGFGAMLKVWPALVLVGTARGRTTRVAWSVAAATGLLLAAAFTAAMPGAWDFLTAQRDRGVEVESLGALVLHVARQFGWEGRVEFHYGSMEFLGPQVELVSTVSLALSALAFGWLLWWRLRAVDRTPTTTADAAFAAVLLFTTTSRVISPQYLLWLIGTAAVCLTLRSGRQLVPALLVLLATPVTLLEFPVHFGAVVASEPLGLTLLLVRNGLLVAASVLSCAGLWRSTVTEPRLRRAGAGLEARPPATHEPRAGEPGADGSGGGTAADGGRGGSGMLTW